MLDQAVIRLKEGLKTIGEEYHPYCRRLLNNLRISCQKEGRTPFRMKITGRRIGPASSLSAAGSRRLRKVSFRDAPRERSVLFHPAILPRGKEVYLLLSCPYERSKAITTALVS